MALLISAACLIHIYRWKDTGTGTKADLDNHANHKEYRGYTSGYSCTGTKADTDSYASKLKPQKVANDETSVMNSHDVMYMQVASYKY